VDRFNLPPIDEPVLRILLVEDSRADADLLVAMLEDELPTAIVSVTASMAGAAPLLAGPLDIAITDLSLPDAEGLEALVAILAARPDIAVVVMTGRQDRELALKALSAGAEDYLVKGAHDARGIATAVLYAAQRRGAELKARRYARLALSLLDAMEAPTCAVDDGGTIIAVNRAWREGVAEGGGGKEATGVGRSYFDVCGATAGDDAQAADAVAAGLRAVLDGRLPRYERDYPCHGPDQERWFSVRINPLPESGAVLSHLDVSKTKRSELALTHLGLHDPLTDLPNRTLLDDAHAGAGLGRPPRRAGCRGVPGRRSVQAGQREPGAPGRRRAAARRVRPADGRGALAGGGRGDVRRQGPWPGPDPPVQRRAARGAAQRRLRLALPAGRGPAPRRGHRRGGARAVGAHRRGAPARRVHPRRGGHRAHRPARDVGAGGGLPAGRRLVRPGARHAYGGELLGPADLRPAGHPVDQLRAHRVGPAARTGCSRR